MKATSGKFVILAVLPYILTLAPIHSFALELPKSSLLIKQNVSNQDATKKIELFINSKTPINALYIHLTYDIDRHTCDSLLLDEERFPLILESSIHNGHIVIAVAQPGQGITQNTSLLTVTCTTSKPSTSDITLTLEQDSRAYLADGFGTEITIEEAVAIR